jgi:putative spermidine/putrescine transport system permease protein
MSRSTLAAWLLLAPLLVLLLANFLAPIGLLLTRAVQDREVPNAWPETAAALRAWDGTGLPPESVGTCFARELADSRRSGTFAAAANRLNFAGAGWRTLLTRTLNGLPADQGFALDGLRRIDERWGRRETWLAIKHAAGPYTDFYLLSTLDLHRRPDGVLAKVAPREALFTDAFVRTFGISAVVTLCCVVLGYPVAYVLAGLPNKIANRLLIFIVLPMWTSVLVRTTAWMVLLQSHGVVNDVLRRIGVIRHPLELIYNRTGVYIAMTHVLLPYAVLPLYGVMRGFSPHSLRAALSLGATPLRTFWQVYLPQTLPGVTAGALIVFILSLGYYITPALIGGPADQMVSSFIAFYTNQSLDWGRAAALSLVLLVATGVCVLLYGRLAGTRETVLR